MSELRNVHAARLWKGLRHDDQAAIGSGGHSHRRKQWNRRGIAEALAAAGAKTALAARRTEMLEEVASGIRDAGGTALPLTTDVTREDQVVRLFKTTYETWGSWTSS